MIRAFKYRLHPNSSQATVLESWLSQCCEIYNAALEQRIVAYKFHGRLMTKYEQQVQLTELRASDPAWRAVPALVQRSALERLDRAFVGFFARCKAGKTKAGFPRFRLPHRYDAFAIHKGAWTEKSPLFQKGRLHIPKLGHIKLNLYRPIAGKILCVTIWRDGIGKWWTSVACDVGDAPPKAPAVRALVGIDLGLTALATLSTGETISNPRYAKRSEDQLAHRQRALARKQKGSKNREKARKLVAKPHAHVANQRLDYARKEVKKLFERFDAVAYEDLSVAALSRSLLSKSFHDASWGVLLRCLTSKAEEAGKYAVPVDHRETSQLCSSCGRVVHKDLSERVHRCICGLTIDRDHNSAITVCARGRRALEMLNVSVDGEVSWKDETKPFLPILETAVRF